MSAKRNWAVEILYINALLVTLIFQLPFIVLGLLCGAIWEGFQVGLGFWFVWWEYAKLNQAERANFLREEHEATISAIKHGRIWRWL